MRILFPAYIWPEDTLQWLPIIHGLAGGLGSVVINPDSGPATVPMPEYEKLCVKLRKADISILGYVATGYGNRDPDLIIQETQRYAEWYHVPNIFLDEAASDLDKLPIYKKLYEQIPGFVVLNHGTIPEEGYLSAGDVLVVFEGDHANHKVAKFPDWLKKHPKHRFAQIVHSVETVKGMRHVMHKIQQTAGYAYITDDLMENPYDRIPQYWEQELIACKRELGW